MYKQMKKVVVIAEEGERKLLRECPIAEELKASCPQVIVAGVGALNIMRSLRDLPLDTEIINIGYAGSANFEIGTWAEVGEVALNHPNVSYPEPEFHLSGSVKCLTGVDFVLKSDYKDCVFDMELAFICGMGFERVRSYKFVSDNLSLHDYREVGSGV